MAHELTITNGKAEMAYVGEIPWHGLGNELQPGAPIEQWIESAGMDWRITRARVRYATARGSKPTDYREFDDRVVLFRGDSGDGLGIVSDRFQVVQPKEVLEFFRDLVGPAGGQLETAGTLFGGRKFWAMAKFGDGQSIVDRRDTVKQNLLLSSSCDGSQATEGKWIATRVVCNNTLQMARGELGSSVKINHRTKFDAAAVKAELGIDKAGSVFERTIADMRRLAATEMLPISAVLNTAELIKPGFAKLETADQEKVLASKPVQGIGRLTLDGVALGSGMQGVVGTAYGWLNAVTQYVDHQARARSVDGRIDSAWFGKGAELKERAFEMAMAGDVELDRQRNVRDLGAVAAVDRWLAQHGGPADDDGIV